MVVRGHGPIVAGNKEELNLPLTELLVVRSKVCYILLLLKLRNLREQNSHRKILFQFLGVLY